MANSIKNNVIFVDTDGVVFTGAARVQAVKVKAAGAAASVILYDATTASGQKMASVGDVAANSFDGISGLRAEFKTAIYADITGASAEVYIYLE